MIKDIIEELIEDTTKLSLKNIEPIKINCSNLRLERQTYNNNLVGKYLKSKDKELLRKNCNSKELDRVLEDLEISLDELIEKCNNDNYLCKLLSRHIAINASRQGAMDEGIILEKCNITANKLDIVISNLSNSDFRPTKDGKIVSKKEIIEQKIKITECFKSFDAKISGKVNGWIFAKITYSNGGHQDSVFEEAYQFCEWVNKYGNCDELYVVLIDTDLEFKFEELKNKYHKNNILIVDHVQFQQYLIDKYR